MCVGPVPVGELVGLLVGVGVRVGPVSVGVAVGLGVLVGVALCVGVLVGPVSDGVGVGAGVLVGVPVAVLVGVWVGSNPAVQKNIELPALK